MSYRFRSRGTAVPAASAQCRSTQFCLALICCCLSVCLSVRMFDELLIISSVFFYRNVKWGLLQTLAATAAHFRPARIFTVILDRICLFHDPRSFVPLAHKCCRGAGEQLKVSVHCTSTVADNTVASTERGSRQTAGEGRRSSSVCVVSRLWTGQRGGCDPISAQTNNFLILQRILPGPGAHPVSCLTL